MHELTQDPFYELIGEEYGRRLDRLVVLLASSVYQYFEARESVPAAVHEQLMGHFRLFCALMRGGGEIELAYKVADANVGVSEDGVVTIPHYMAMCL